MCKPFFVITAFLSMSFSSLKSCSQKDTLNIRGLKISYDIPVVNRNGSLLENKNFFTIFFYEDLLMIELRHKYDSTYSGKLIKEQFRYNYFVYKQGNKYGIFYDLNNSFKNNIKMQVDSLLEKRALQNFKWDVMAVYKPTESYYDETNNILEEVYGPEIKAGSPSKDTIRFYYTKKLKNFDYSFSKKLDSIKHMKLFKIKLQYGEVYSDEHKIIFPKRETLFEMNEISVQNPKVIIDLFGHYKKNTLNYLPQ